MRKFLHDPSREAGNTLILALMLTFFMMALSTAQFLVVQKNYHQSAYMVLQDDVRAYAESGANLALHDLRYDVTGNDGKIGTTAWTTLSDYGRDGLPATGDYGEGDGRPTPGEPNLAPVPIGPAGSGIQLIVYTEDSAWASIKRIVSIAFSGEAEAVVDTFAERGVTRVPRVGAMYVPPAAAIDLHADALTLSGFDTNPDGTAGTDSPRYALGTDPGSPPGTSRTAILDQIPIDQQDQIHGLGGDPSVGEGASALDVQTLFNSLVLKKDQEIASGSYANVVWGTSAAYQTTYVNGDLQLGGDVTGAGVLLVNGNLTLTGQLNFAGLVIVMGDVQQIGGGAGTHLFGTIMVRDTITMVDDIDLGILGPTELKYSAQALDTVETLLATSGNPYTVLYWHNIK